MTGSVLHVDTSLGWRGGQQQVYLLHRELVRRGVGSRLLAREGGSLARRCEEKALPFTLLPGRRPWAPRVLAGLWQTLARADGACLVHAHDAHAALLGSVAKTLRPRTRLVCHRRVSYPLGRSGLSRWRYGRANAWIAVSREIGAILEGAGVPEERIRVIHSAVDLEEFRSEAALSDRAELRAELGIPPGAAVVGFCGAFSPQKGHEVLLEAAPAILRIRPEAVFLLPGEGELLAEMRQLARAKGLEKKVLFPGFRSDVASLTALFTVGVVPSVDGEGSSASVKEPMALAVPVVASDLPGNLEAMEEGGLAFPNRSSADLAQAVLLLLNDEALRAELGERARRQAERFSVEAMADATLALYADLEEGRV